MTRAPGHPRSPKACRPRVFWPAFIALALLSKLAFADWIPITTYRGNTVVIQAGGGRYTYSEPSTPTSTTRIVGDRLTVVPRRLQDSLNTVVAQQVANPGASFMGARVGGLPTVTIRPDVSGALDLQMTTPSGAINLTITELVSVQWQWQSTCLAEDPYLVCYEP